MTEIKLVTLSSVSGPITRVLVEDLGSVVRVCREEEYVDAERVGRDPVTMAFLKKDILSSN